MIETGLTYGEEGDVIYNIFRELYNFSGNCYLEKKIFPGSITVEVFIPPRDFSFMVRNFMIKAKSCICKALFTKRVLQETASIEGEMMQKKKKGIFNNPVGLPFSHESPRKTIW